MQTLKTTPLRSSSDRSRTPTRVDVIGVPMDLGADRRGVDMGPSAIRYARLQKRLQCELNRVAASHVGIAAEHGEESFPVQSRKLLPVWCRNRFSRLGSEM